MPGLTVSAVINALDWAWDQFRKQAHLSTVVLSGNIGNGGSLLGPNIGPIMKDSPDLGAVEGAKDRQARDMICKGIGDAASAWCGAVHVRNLVYPSSFLHWTGPMHPPTANIPKPVADCIPNVSFFDDDFLKAQMGVALQTDEGLKEVMKHAAKEAADFFKMWTLSQSVSNILASGNNVTWSPQTPEGPITGAIGAGFPFR